MYVSDKFNKWTISVDMNGTVGIQVSHSPVHGDIEFEGATRFELQKIGGMFLAAAEEYKDTLVA